MRQPTDGEYAWLRYRRIPTRYEVSTEWTTEIGRFSTGYDPTSGRGYWDTCGSDQGLDPRNYEVEILEWIPAVNQQH